MDLLERGALAAMGTRFEIIVAGEPGSHARASNEAALAEIGTVTRLWSPFSGDSMLARLHDPMREVVPIDGLTLELLSLCERLERRPVEPSRRRWVLFWLPVIPAGSAMRGQGS